MDIKEANIIPFYELSEEWREEAVSNLGRYSEEALYLEPDDLHCPEKHILRDLTECMSYKGEHEGFKYNASIAISNNSAMLLNISDDGETATYIYV